MTPQEAWTIADKEENDLLKKVVDLTTPIKDKSESGLSYDERKEMMLNSMKMFSNLMGGFGKLGKVLNLLDITPISNEVGVVYFEKDLKRS